MAFDAIQAIGACYETPDGDDAWVEHLARTLEPLGRGLGVAAGLLELRDGAPVLLSRAAAGPPPGCGDSAVRTLEALPGERVSRWLASPPGVQHVDRRLGLPNALVLFASAGNARLAAVAISMAAGRRAPPRLQRTCRLLAAHLGAAAGVRGELEPGRRGGRLLQSEPSVAGALWHGLWDGDWVVVGRRPGDGSHGLLLRRRDPNLGDPRALTERERAVLAIVAEGRSNKEAAWILSIATATVATHLGSALRKLGLQSRGELIALFATSREDAGRAGPGSARHPQARDELRAALAAEGGEDPRDVELHRPLLAAQLLGDGPVRGAGGDE